MDKGTKVCVGSLDDDLASLGARIVKELASGPRTVWVDGGNRVFLCDAAEQPDCAQRWIAGTFFKGLHVDEIADDLREIQKDRSTNGIVDVPIARE